MYEPNLERVAYKMIRDVLRVQPGDHVLVEVRSDAVPFAELVAIETFKVGGTCTLFLFSDELDYVEATEAQTGQLARPTNARIAAIRACQHFIQIGLSPAEPARFQDIDARRNDALQQRKHSIAAELVQPGHKWLSMEFPTRYMAESIRLPWNRLQEQFWRATDVDYGALAGRAAAITEVLEKSSEIRVTSTRGTDLYVRRGNRSIHRDDGYVRTVGNLPTGEVSFAPLEETVTGRVVADYTSYLGQRIVDLDLVFENGLCTPVGASSGYDVFMHQWNSATGDKNRLGEVGIGLNEEVRAPVGLPALDNMAYGAVRLALGDNSIRGGLNHSTFQWNLLLTRATLIADNRLVLQNGQFVEL